VPNSRSNISCVEAMVNTASAVTISTLVISTIHVKIGMRMRRIPGARRLTMVMMKFSDAMIEDRPMICRPRT
jgi:hypothetical protein